MDRETVAKLYELDIEMKQALEPVNNALVQWACVQTPSVRIRADGRIERDELEFPADLMAYRSTIESYYRTLAENVIAKRSGLCSL